MYADEKNGPRWFVDCRAKCLQSPKSVALADALDIRVLKAARYLKDNKLAVPVLIGSPVKIREFAAENKINTVGLKIRKPAHDPQLEHVARVFFEKRKEKGLERAEARELLKKPLWYAASLLERGQADLALAGNLSATADVLKAGIQMLGLQSGIETVSSFFMLISPNNLQTFAFADGAVVPRPTAEQLADIAISTSRNFERLTLQEALVALLSFSTAGSAEHPLAVKVKHALELVRERQPGLKIDGEIQFDAAIDAGVASKKAPLSPLQGQANVLVFPSLNAANIGYKIAERLGGFTAVGPFIQGLRKPFHDLSRGCSTEDIINTVLVGSCLI